MTKSVYPENDEKVTCRELTCLSETNLDEQENKDSQEVKTTILTTADLRNLTLEEGLNILSEMTTRSSEEHRRLFFSERVVENAKKIGQH